MRQPPNSFVTDGLVSVPELISARQLYKLLGMDKRSFYRELAVGRIPPPIRIGDRRTRWRADRIREWLDSLEK